MERREFLRLGAAAGVAAATGTSCSALNSLLGTGHATAALSVHEMDAYLSQLDKAMDGISRGNILGELIPSDALVPVQLEAEIDEKEKLIKKALRTMVVTAAYNDLPEVNRTHSGMQARLQRAMPEIDEAVFGMTASLAALNDDERAEVQRTLRRQPDLGVKISEGLDTAAKKLGVPLKRRLQMRSALTTLSWRMRVQKPGLLIDEYVEKVKKTTARHGQTEELKRHLAAAASNELFWREQRHAAMTAVKQAEPENPAAGPTHRRKPLKKPPPLEPEKKPKRLRVKKKGGTAITVGAVMMGVGGATALAGGLSLGLGSSAGAITVGFIALIVGAIILLVGLIPLIIGLVRRRRS